MLDAGKRSISSLGTWASTPRGCWIKPVNIDAAEAELARLQRPIDDLTLTIADVREARDEFHKFAGWAVSQGLDPRLAKITIYAGDVPADESSPKTLATYCVAKPRTLEVFRTMAPSWATKRGRVVLREIVGPDREHPHQFEGRAGYRFGGRWVWR